MKLPTYSVKTGQVRQGLPGYVDTITGSASRPAPAAGRPAFAEAASRRQAGHPADLPVTISPWTLS